jgi:outer membrane receptor protein involved in Fe transport
LNAALTWTSDSERFEVSGWVRNFLDEHYKTQNFDLTRGLGIILDAYADPRMSGVTVTFNF